MTIPLIWMLLGGLAGFSVGTHLRLRRLERMAHPPVDLRPAIRYALQATADAARSISTSIATPVPPRPARHRFEP